MQPALHPVPRQRDVIREQIRIVGLGFRREALAVAITLGVVTAFIIADIVRGTAESWFDSDEWAGIAVLSFFFPFAVWRREKRFGPAFLWTLPVDRTRLAFARMFAGWVWLMATVAVFVSWQLALALFSRVADPEIVALSAFPGTTAAYLIGTALVLGLRHPLRLLLGIAGLGFIIGMLNQTILRGALDGVLASLGFFTTIERAYLVWRDLPPLAQAFLTILLLLGAGLLALWAAVRRHGERRRR